VYNPFTKHPNAVGETYLQHMMVALKFHFILLYFSFTALVHAIFPFLCEFTVSDGIKKLSKKMTERADTAKNSGPF